MTDNLLLLFIVGVIIIFMSAAAVYTCIIRPFMDEREYIKGELNRSDDEEYFYWEQELKNFYIDHIPVIGWFIRKFRR